MGLLFHPKYNFEKPGFRKEFEKAVVRMYIGVKAAYDENC